MTALDSKATSSTGPPCSDRSPFLNWSGGQIDDDHKSAVIFQSLVATLKFQPALDGSLETKAVKFLEGVVPRDQESADSIVVLLSSPSQAIMTATMKLLDSLIEWCSEKLHLALVKVNLIPQIINTLNPLSPSFAEVEDFHTYLISTISSSLWLSTPAGLAHLAIEDDNEQQAVHETVLKQVLVPSEKFICHLCMNRNSTIDEDLGREFMRLLARLLEIYPSYQPTKDFVLNMPVIFTIPNWLTFLENDRSIWYFLYAMIKSQRGWNKKRGEVRQMWNEVLRLLRMEGFCDVIEAQQQNVETTTFGRLIVPESIAWNNMQGMNLPYQE
ncbi:hypothetical protein BLNAU_18138 [Blattamonas nauphoetae]|uniref:Uncharacterized protein n=1 Tax=Blattamonas nauphoetae TaxID=2049346 RepID=A0ABQ9X6G9_9EUKA|nr:hypothetical protein BLNAU_18138 [Blattamonas nauphoetae]